MKLLKTKLNKSLWTNDIDENFDRIISPKIMIGECQKKDIMLYLDKTTSFFDSDNLASCFLYYVLHPKYGVCWLWADKKTDIIWI